MANRFGRAGGNWSAAGTWSATSGGASDGAGLNAGDDVILDSNSSGTFTIDGAISIATLVCTGFTGTLTQSANFTVTGDTFTLVPGMTYTPTSSRLVTFTPASGHTVTVTSAGKSFGLVTLTGADATATLTPADAFSVNASTTASLLTVNAGIFDASANNVAVTLAGFASPNGSARTIKMGSGTWTMTGDDFTQNTWSIGTTATLTAGTSTLIFSKATPLSTVSFSTGGQTYNIVTLSAGPNFPTSVTGTGATFGTLNVTSPTKTVQFQNGSTFTITNALNISGSVSNPILFESNVGFAVPTLAIASGSVTNWVSFRGITLSGSGTKLIATNGFDFGENNFNSGTVTAPGGGGRIIGG